MSNRSDKLDIVEIMKNASADDRIPCAKVFEVIKEYTFFPDIAGFTLTQNKIKLTFCQLGLFGYPEGKNIPECESVSEELEDKIFDRIEDDKLPCAAAWNIAAELKITKLEVTSACEKLGIKINKCQLGAF
ncbi:MAG: hypothetical protein CVV49_03165 [Spirochaetae bacterium HGW-Spirochaetae-5]|nr:MAG: hypothetical protein CVV49_03165 [Spirochaetae bacterium HGW-Spirochaetae-5]